MRSSVPTAHYRGRPANAQIGHPGIHGFELSRLPGRVSQLEFDPGNRINHRSEAGIYELSPAVAVAMSRPCGCEASLSSITG